MRLFPGDAARLRPAARERLLLRHRFADADHRGRLPAHRGGDAQDHRRRRAVRALRAADRRGARAWCADLGQQYKVEHIDDDLKQYPIAELLPPGRVHRPVPRPAHPARRQGRGVQAAEHRRRLLEERPAAASSCNASTPPPSSTRRTSTPTCTRSKRRRSATTACWASSSSCSPSASGRQRPDPVDAQGRDRARPPGDASSRTSCSSAATSRSTRRTSAGWSCTAPAAISRTTATPSFRRCPAIRWARHGRGDLAAELDRASRTIRSKRTDAPELVRHAVSSDGRRPRRAGAVHQSSATTSMQGRRSD